MVNKYSFLNEQLSINFSYKNSFTVISVHCVLYTCVLYSVYCTVCTVQCVLYSVYYTACTVQCVLYSVYTLYAVQCVLYSVCCTVCAVQCVLYSILNYLHKLNLGLA